MGMLPIKIPVGLGTKLGPIFVVLAAALGYLGHMLEVGQPITVATIVSCMAVIWRVIGGRMDQAVAILQNPIVPNPEPREPAPVVQLVRRGDALAADPGDPPS